MTAHQDNTRPQTPMSPLLTAEQAADYLKIGVSTLNRYKREGRIRATYICSDARYHIDDLDAFIDAARNRKDDAA